MLKDQTKAKLKHKKVFSHCFVLCKYESKQRQTLAATRETIGQLKFCFLFREPLFVQKRRRKVFRHGDETHKERGGERTGGHFHVVITSWFAFAPMVSLFADNVNCKTVAFCCLVSFSGRATFTFGCLSQCLPSNGIKSKGWWWVGARCMPFGCTTYRQTKYWAPRCERQVC